MDAWPVVPADTMAAVMAPELNSDPIRFLAMAVWL